MMPSAEDLTLTITLKYEVITEHDASLLISIVRLRVEHDLDRACGCTCKTLTAAEQHHAREVMAKLENIE